MRMVKGAIAFFDSGIGGLTVVKECRKWLPSATFYYYGDNMHAPYGNLSEEKIKKYVFEVFKRFKKLQVGAAVVACNTATAVCVEALRKEFFFPIIGTEPAILPAMRNGGEVYVLTTRATHNSTRFQALCKNAQMFFPNVTLRAFACDALAGEIEKHVFDLDFDYTALLPNGKPDAVVLGCTHYIYIKEQIERFYRCRVYDGNSGIANRLNFVLWEDSYFREHLQPLGNHFQPFLGENEGQKREVEGCLRGETIFLGGYGKHNKRIYERLFG